MRGFTLIELLTVIAVLGILVAGAMIVINPIDQLQKANDETRKSDLVQIQKAMERYDKDHGSYPLSTGLTKEKPFRIKGFRADHQIVDWGEEWSPYMAVLPKDPKSEKRYLYISSGNGQSYRLYASLEREGNNPQDVPAGATCGGIKDICNYGVSSPNISP